MVGCKKKAVMPRCLFMILLNVCIQQQLGVASLACTCLWGRRAYINILVGHVPPVPPPPVPPHICFAISAGQTIRRGGVRLGRAVGNFFGVTNESAYGSSNQVGWARVGEQSAEETFTTTRRLSFRSILQDEPPPEYPGGLYVYLNTTPLIGAPQYERTEHSLLLACAPTTMNVTSTSIHTCSPRPLSF